MLADLYVNAARSWIDTHIASKVISIGVGGAGLTWASIVAASLRDAGVDATAVSFHPDDQPLDGFDLTERLEPAVQVQPDAVFLLVDDGSSSCLTMAAVADALSALGIEDRRIVLMPGRAPDIETFSDPDARIRWRRHVVRSVTPSAAAR